MLFGFRRQLVVSSGDISDIDRFLALAEYAKTGIDLVFVLNFPSYVDILEDDASHEAANLGLGFKYSSKHVFENVPAELPKSYTDFLQHYGELPKPSDEPSCLNKRMRSAK